MNKIFNQIYGAIENNELTHLKFKHDVVFKDDEIIDQSWTLNNDGVCPLDEFEVSSFLKKIEWFDKLEDTEQVELIVKNISKLIADDWSDTHTRFEYI